MRGAQRNVTSGQQFTATQRALILLGSAPFVLMGCAVHEARQQPASLLPPPGSATSSYRVAVPVPPPPPPLPQAPADLTRAITTLLANFNGTAAAAVTSIDSGWTVAYNGSRPMPQQSVSKLWVAMTALDLLDQGKLTLDDPVVVRREDLTLFHQPIASLVKGDGYHTTVRELMRRALTMSDNTANDRLLTYVGGPNAVRAFLARRGIQNIRFGPGERLLQSKTAGLTWRQEYSLGGGFNQARSALPQSVRIAAFNAYVANPPDGAGATAIAEALMRLKQGKLLSPNSTRYLLDTMAASRTGRARLHAALPPGWTLAHKTGTGQDLMSRNAGFNDVGILTAPDGRSYAVAVLIGDTRAPMRDRQQLIQQVVHALVANRS
nr:hypothetical protein GCM10017606_09450 [Microbacterium terregens]